MPIKRFEESVRPQFPRLGKLRKGDEKTDPKKPGKDLKHFRFTSPRPEVVMAFVAAYGQEPAVVNAFLPFAESSENFSYWQEKWAAGGLVHRCDGETCIMWQEKDGTYSTEPKPCPGGCTEVGRLEVIIPELLRAGYVGYVTMETHSINDILSILGSLAETADNRAGHPDGLKGIMFVLRRVPESISTPPWQEGGPRKRVTKWLVKLEPAADWVKLQLEIAHAGAMGLTGGEILSLPELNGGNDIEPEPGTEDAIEGVIVTEEPPIGATATDITITNDKGTSRPLDPDKLRKFLWQKAGDDPKPASEAQAPFVARKFQECFAPAKDAKHRYHTALHWLWGVDSATKLTWGQATVTLNWLLDPAGPDSSGDTPLHKHAPDEARRVYNAALTEQRTESATVRGQQELFDA